MQRTSRSRHRYRDHRKDVGSMLDDIAEALLHVGKHVVITVVEHLFD
ncbi:hypothetical protein GCM10009779_36050 [Polymorphospora rubra]|uniref:Uncharacterized protein n=1 Tax=Polymorphospora rubra TaxID=338584 RepID=A0A810NAX9_9ACTN|nr:hypothetical protein Prubr_72610 [Polymorphospora rubra]